MLFSLICCCCLYIPRRCGTVGMQYLEVCGGKVYWELRVVTAKGFAAVGFAGTSFGCGQQAILGTDRASWAVCEQEGKCCALHIQGCVVFIPPLSEPRA
jgi:hypothetical protein